MHVDVWCYLDLRKINPHIDKILDQDQRPKQMLDRTETSGILSQVCHLTDLARSGPVV